MLRMLILLTVYKREDDIQCCHSENKPKSYSIKRLRDDLLNIQAACAEWSENFEMAEFDKTVLDLIGCGVLESNGGKLTISKSGIESLNNDALLNIISDFAKGLEFHYFIRLSKEP